VCSSDLMNRVLDVAEMYVWERLDFTPTGSIFEAGVRRSEYSWYENTARSGLGQGERATFSIFGDAAPTLRTEAERLGPAFGPARSGWGGFELWTGPERQLSDGGLGSQKLLRPALTDTSRLLDAGGETSLTREQVARFRGTGRERGNLFNQYLAEANKGTREVYAETQLGARFHDVGDIPTGTATKLRVEGKNYLKFKFVNGQAVAGEVPLTAEIHTQIYKDVLWIREGRKIGENRVVQWDFGGAPPSRRLAEMLDFWGLPYVH